MNAIARPLLLELSETAAHTREIALAVAGFEIRGQLALEGAVLHLEGRDGSVSAQRLVITSVTITGHGVRLGARLCAGVRPRGGRLPRCRRSFFGRLSGGGGWRRCGDRAAPDRAPRLRTPAGILEAETPGGVRSFRRTALSWHHRR